MHFKSVGPSMEALCCIFSQSAPWRLCTALSSVDPPPRGGFVLHSLSVGPSVEAFTSISISQPLRGGFVLHFPSVGPSVEALYFVFQSAPPWRLCTAFQVSRPLRGGFVLHFQSVGPSVVALYCISSR